MADILEHYFLGLQIKSNCVHLSESGFVVITSQYYTMCFTCQAGTCGTTATEAYESEFTCHLSCQSKEPSLAIMSTIGRMSAQAVCTKHHRVLREGEGECGKDKRDIKKGDSCIGSTSQIPSLMAIRNGRITFS